MFKQIAVGNNFIYQDNVPSIPSIKQSKDKKHRRDDLAAKEWEELERVARLYYIKGKTRILDENYTIKKTVKVGMKPSPILPSKDHEVRSN